MADRSLQFLKQPLTDFEKSAIEQAVSWALPKRHAALSVVHQLIFLHEKASSKKAIPYFTICKVSSMRGVKNRNAATEIIGELEALGFIRRFGYSKSHRRDAQGRFFRWGRIFTFNMKRIASFLHRLFKDDWQKIVGQWSLVREDLCKDFNAYENEIARQRRVKTEQDKEDRFFRWLGGEIEKNTAAISSSQAVVNLKGLLQQSYAYPQAYRLQAISIIQDTIEEYQGYRRIEGIKPKPSISLQSLLDELEQITPEMPREEAQRRLKSIANDVDRLKTPESVERATQAVLAKLEAFQKSVHS